MLYRHAMLVVNYLGTHPEYKEAEGRKAVWPLMKRTDSILKDLETTLKPAIENQRKEWERMTPQSLPAAQKAASTPTSYLDYASRDPTLQGNAKILDASEHQDLAVDLAREELKRRDEVRRSQRSTQTDDYDLQRQLEATRNTLERARRGEHHDEADSVQPSAQHYNYPSVSRSAPVQLDGGSTMPPERPVKPAGMGRPDLPPKEAMYGAMQRDVPSQPPGFDRPLLPPKELMAAAAAPVRPKKERLTFKPGAYLENGDPIRSLFIPSKLRQSFLDVAAKHTAAGLELCGILCGTPVNNALFVRCLLIPDQKSTSDTCETENEASMAEYCMNEDLMILGWIHTHPTQTCFMSSRDLHTHAGYQVMMPESVAIVCAPRYTPS